MRTEIRKCAAAEIFDHPASAALFAEHADECANPLLGRTCPRRAMYDALEAAGVGHTFAAHRDGDLAGFAFVLRGPMPHYEGVFATVESLFVGKQARHGGLGRHLMDAIEAYAAETGCAAIFYSAPVGSRMARMMALQPSRYRRTNLIFTRRLR